MRLFEYVLAAWQRRKQAFPSKSSQTFDEYLTEATFKAQNPSASDVSLLAECFGMGRQVESTSAAKSSTKRPAKRRKIA